MTHKNGTGFVAFFIMATFLIANQGCATRSSQEGIMVNNQGQIKSDLEITQDIRQEIIADRSLSMYAHNVKIVVRNGIVKLRGPVSSAQERELVVSIASRVTGIKRILNQMSVAS